MAEFIAPIGKKHRHQFVVPGYEYGIRVHVDDIYLKKKLAAQPLQRSEHVVAKVAIGPGQ
jgi:hypothetical protein